MSGGWEVGDLALCVRLGRGGLNHPTRLGRVYEVERVWLHPEGGLSLDFVGIENGKQRGFPYFWGHTASRFRKVTPPEADEFDREVIEQMTGNEVPA